ncbi:DinB family protein [Kineosporia sp. J2-2]|uniref:DinB family protein n=1 Tax=Kineosporia corallincola TaxID=2835133 RepID=A0ABS5TEC5_9ACTN|nr:DinB family protein [Kineosporia corallincola]MBT0769425.1 DinB family protein [Kineosporia corallincola]
MDDSRWHLSHSTDERALLLAFLDFQRDALARKCSLEDDAELRRRSVPTSHLTLIGLLRHLAAVERWYFQVIAAQQSPPELYTETDDPAEEFTHLATATGESARATWHTQVDHSRRITAELALDDALAHPTHGRPLTLRWILLHMIDEYARHNGHADLIREAIDGSTGE